MAQTVKVHQHTRKGGSVLVREYERGDPRAQERVTPTVKRSKPTNKPDPEDGTGVEIGSKLAKPDGEHIVQREGTELRAPSDRRGKGVKIIGGQGAKQGQGVKTLGRS